MNIDELRHELFLAPMKSNFTFTRDELIALIGLPEARRTVSGQEAATCRHEPFEGRCVHCDVPFVNGHAAPIPATEPKEPK